MKAIALSFFLLSFACTGKRAPAVPDVNGPSSGRPGDTLVFTVVTVDPDGDAVSYRFQWGDTSALEWSGWYASGQPVVRMRVYPDTGSFPLRVQARDDEEAESGWSDSLLVRIGLLPPGRPARPTGPGVCTSGVRHEFRTRSIHPQGEDVQFQFDWNGTLGAWSGFVASGDTCTVEHMFDSAGAYIVSARARDRDSLLSDWSDAVTFQVVTIAGAPPRNPRMEPGSDSTLLLHWDVPDSGTPGAYGVFFRPAGAAEFALAGETTGLSYEHFPAGFTGSYRVGARFGAAWFIADTVMSTLPTTSDNVTIYELNMPGDAGYGWDRLTGLGTTQTMRDSLSPLVVDFYVTDFDTGTAGPVYFLATPDTVPFDPGDSLPQGNWRRTLFCGPLANDRDPLPPAADTCWRPWYELGSTPDYVGVLAVDTCFAVLKLTNVRPNHGDVRAQSTFQPIPGLRLIRR